MFLLLLATNKHDRKYRFFIHFHQTIFFCIFFFLNAFIILSLYIYFLHLTAQIFIHFLAREVKKNNWTLCFYYVVMWDSYTQRNAIANTHKTHIEWRKKRKKKNFIFLLFWCLFKLLVLHVRQQKKKRISYWMENDSAIISFFVPFFFIIQK